MCTLKPRERNELMYEELLEVLNVEISVNGEF